MRQVLTRLNALTDSQRAVWWWALVLGILSYQVAKGHLAGFDQVMASWVGVLRSPWLDMPVRAITFFGSSLWMLVALGGLGCLAWRRGGLQTVLILLGTVAVSLVLEVLLRYSVSSWRPDTVGVSEDLEWFARFRLAGYPSGHAFRSALVFGWLMRVLRSHRQRWAAVVRTACLVMIGLVGFTRLYLNRHWASDVVGSWLVVLVAMAIGRCWEEAQARA